MFLKNEIHVDRAMELFGKCGLKRPRDVDYTIGVFDKGRLIATGSLSGNIMKGLAVDPDYQGQALTNTVVSDLMSHAFVTGIEDLYIFSGYCNRDKFMDLGFKEVSCVRNKVCFFERTNKGIGAFKKNLEGLKEDVEGSIAGIVMNCNPFTLGHLYLVDKAASENEFVYVIMVEEDASVFPFETRMDLVRKGTAHLDNVKVISGGKYVISRMTFPSYFTHDKQEEEFHTSLDLKVFGRHIGPTLDIRKRYVGIEPYCKTTDHYNETMKMELPNYGIEVVEVDRRKSGSEYISASIVRKLIKEDRIEETLEYLPETTYEYLMSEEGRQIVEKIKSSDSDDYINNKIIEE